MKTIESNIRSYCRSFPVKFVKAKDSYMYDEKGTKYLDFFTGAGTINYGHNNSKVSSALIQYLQEDNILHSLDLDTEAKEIFLTKFNEYILTPRNLNYKVQFVAPSGANGVEAAIKLARKAKKRKGIISFTNSFHGMSQGALSITGNSYYKNEYIATNIDVDFMMFDNYLGTGIDTSSILEKLLNDDSSGIDIPAGVILETIQADGGVNIASDEWLQNIERICKKFDILLIIDDVQVGNGRSGDFFSFEKANIKPDIVVLSKAIGGGMPMAIVLIDEEVDKIWKVGEHTGTFRGNNLAYIAGAEVLDYWKNNQFSLEIKEKSKLIDDYLLNFMQEQERIKEIRGRGLIFGIELANYEDALATRNLCFKNELIVELVGANDNIVKLLPPLTISHEDLLKGLKILTKSISQVLNG